MAGNYTVKQGDHLSSIAKDFGFSDFQPIWDDGNNAELKEQRKNPSVLFPGDVVFIPDRDTRVESGATDKRHKFVVRARSLKLRLVLEDLYEKPLANAECDLSLGPETRHVTADENGKIEEIITPQTHDAVLLIKDEQTPFQEVRLPIRIGHLDPFDEFSGQKTRLNNLGYFPGDAKTAEDERFRSAVEEFQCDHHLAVDGVCGPKTQEKLKQIHGC